MRARQQILVFGVLVLSGSMTALSWGYAGGSGTRDDPYQIAGVEDLAKLDSTPADKDKHFILVANVGLSGTWRSKAVIDSFSGTFDGNGFAMRPLRISGKDYLGLFGKLESGSRVVNLRVADVDVKGSGDHVGGLAGLNMGEVSHCTSTCAAGGAVAGVSDVGGLVGSNAGKVKDSQSDCRVIGSRDHTGGLVGLNTGSVVDSNSTGRVSGVSVVAGLIGYNNGSVSRCHSTGTVNGSDMVGGLVGLNETNMVQCYSTGAVTGSRAGGLVGLNHGTVADCQSTGMVSGPLNVGGLVGANGGSLLNCRSSGQVVATWDHSAAPCGGLVGWNRGSVFNCCSSGQVTGETPTPTGGLVGENVVNGSVSNCRSTGGVTGGMDAPAGGLVGENAGSVHNCYSTSPVRGGSGYYAATGGLVGDNRSGVVTCCYSTGVVTSVVATASKVGGLIGLNVFGNVLSSFWDVETSGRTTSSGGVGASTSQMKDIETFLGAEWDFVGESEHGTKNIWFMPEKDYPCLVWEFISGIGIPVHSYTFEDGTANDSVGEAHGTLKGDAKIENGSLVTVDQNDWMEMPGDVIAMNTYSDVTIEAWYTPTASANPGNSMLAYFGDSVNGLGSNGYFITSARSDDKSRAAISIGITIAPWEAESGVDGPEHDDGVLHHMVSSLNAAQITLYIDGVLIATTPLAAHNSISGISPKLACLAKGGYGGDPEWIGKIHEFNIYNKALSDVDVAALYAGGL